MVAVHINRKNGKPGLLRSGSVRQRPRLEPAPPGTIASVALKTCSDFCTLMSTAAETTCDTAAMHLGSSRSVCVTSVEQNKAQAVGRPFSSLTPDRGTEMFVQSNAMSALGTHTCTSVLFKNYPYICNFERDDMLAGLIEL